MKISFLPDNVLVPFVRALAAKRKLRFSRIKLRAHILFCKRVLYSKLYWTNL